MLKVNFYDLGSIKEDNISFVVVHAKYKDKWIVVRHKDRITWETPGGHKEEFEKLDEAASRELYEEAGAKCFELTPVCIYSVKRDGEKESYGQLYYGMIKVLDNLPQSEIKEINLVEELPNNLTYPSIQPSLYDRILEFLDSENNNMG